MQGFKTMPCFSHLCLAQIHQHMYKCVGCTRKYHREMRATALVPAAPLHVIHQATVTRDLWRLVKPKKIYKQFIVTLFSKMHTVFLYIQRFHLSKINRIENIITVFNGLVMISPVLYMMIIMFSWAGISSSYIIIRHIDYVIPLLVLSVFQ